jgi:outer membrane receptor for ferrienterochelin and colicins
MMKRGPFSLTTGPVAILLFMLAVVVAAYGQHQQVTIRVLDQKSGEPVAFAHVCFEGLKSGKPKYGMTTLQGTIPNEVSEKSRIVISYVGYITYSDTIQPGEALQISLKPAILNMDEVVVTGQYTPERADKSIYKIEVINARQIEQKAATNMADLLKNESNMRVSQDGVLGTSLRIQGLSGENVKFLMDGVPMIGRMNGNFDLNQISLYNVDHVELIEGPMSVIYGSNALAGVINIITKENKGSLLTTTANAYWESVGVFNFDASVSSTIKKHGFSLTGGRNFFDGWSPKPDTSRSQTFIPRRQYFFDGYYSFTTDKLKIKVAGDYFNELLLDRGALQPPYYIYAFDNYFTTIRYSLRLEGALKLPRSHFINILASYSDYARQKQTWFKDLTTLEKSPVTADWGHDTTTITSWMARATFAKNNPDKKFNYQTGIDINVESGSGKRITGYSQSIGDYAAFVSLRWDPVKVLSIQPGLRLIYNTKYPAPLVYALSAKWNVTGGLNLRLSYAHGFRAPSLKELYLFFKDINHDIQGNPDLKAETSNNINLNINWGEERKKHAWSLDLTGFYNRINNVILLAPVGSGLEYTYVNLSKYMTTGVQFSAGFDLHPALKLQLGFSETGITGAIDPEMKMDPLKWATELSLSATYHFVRPEITLALYYKYTGKTPQVVVEDTGISWGEVDPFNTMDITATKGFWSNRIRISAGVKNLFNVTTIPATGTGGGHGSGGDGMNISWGRSLFLKLTFVFNRYK